MRVPAIGLIACLALAMSTSPLRASDRLAAGLEANKAIVRQFLAALEQGDMVALGRVRGTSVISHGSSGDRVDSAPPSCPMCAAMSDLRIAIDVMVAEGDLVAVRSTWTGLFSGTFGEMTVAEPRPVRVYYTNIYRIADGRVVENWFVSDRLALAGQLGYTLTPPAESNR